MTSTGSVVQRGDTFCIYCEDSNSNSLVTTLPTALKNARFSPFSPGLNGIVSQNNMPPLFIKYFATFCLIV